MRFFTILVILINNTLMQKLHICWKELVKSCYGHLATGKYSSFFIFIYDFFIELLHQILECN